MNESPEAIDAGEVCVDDRHGVYIRRLQRGLVCLLELFKVECITLGPGPCLPYKLYGQGKNALSTRAYAFESS